jgi:hypothetical protein
MTLDAHATTSVSASDVDGMLQCLRFYNCNMYYTYVLRVNVLFHG